MYSSRLFFLTHKTSLLDGGEVDTLMPERNIKLKDWQKQRGKKNQPKHTSKTIVLPGPFCMRSYYTFVVAQCNNCGSWVIKEKKHNTFLYCNWIIKVLSFWRDKLQLPGKLTHMYLPCSYKDEKNELLLCIWLICVKPWKSQHIPV